MVCLRTAVRNQLHALAMGQGVYRKSKLWAAKGRTELEALALDPWASRRRRELSAILDRLDASLTELDRAVDKEAQLNPAARDLMEQPGVGRVTALMFVLTIGPVEAISLKTHRTCRMCPNLPACVKGDELRQLHQFLLSSFDQKVSLPILDTVQAIIGASEFGTEAKPDLEIGVPIPLGIAPWTNAGPVGNAIPLQSPDLISNGTPQNEESQTGRKRHPWDS